jgi:transcriptional regulator of arginine metabolism
VLVNATKTRREQIRDILARENLTSQEELMQVLARRGVHTTQPVVSRDLRALRVAKRAGVYQLLEHERVTRLDTLRSLLRSACSAGPNMVVMRTEPGAANAIARALEADQIDGLLGTVAGDDTLFVAVHDADVGQAILDRVTPLLQ